MSDIELLFAEFDYFEENLNKLSACWSGEEYENAKDSLSYLKEDIAQLLGCRVPEPKNKGTFDDFVLL